jgi:hypothetical protein
MSLDGLNKHFLYWHLIDRVNVFKKNANFTNEKQRETEV